MALTMMGRWFNNGFLTKSFASWGSASGSTRELQVAWSCMLYVNPVAVWAQLCCCKLFFLAQAHVLAQAHFRLKHSRCISDAPSGGSLVAVGWAAATQVSEPPRGCRWETDIHGNIGLRMLTLFTHDQSVLLIGYVYSICVRASPYVV